MVQTIDAQDVAAYADAGIVTGFHANIGIHGDGAVIQQRKIEVDAIARGLLLALELGPIDPQFQLLSDFIGQRGGVDEQGGDQDA